MTTIHYIKTILGPIKIITNNTHLLSAELISDENIKKYHSDPKSVSLCQEINDYLTGHNSDLTSKFKLSGTKFQIKVWRGILKIPRGETRTYGRLAESIGYPTACRAVANACGQNNLVLFVPCHRVVGKNNIGGYKWGIEMKQWILDMEKNKN